MTSSASAAQPARFGSGQHVRRLEDEPLLKGQGRYTDDVQPAGQARLVLLRSPYAHANIRSIDVSAAQAMPGVRLVVTGAELAAAGVAPLAGAAGFMRADGKPVTSAPRHALAVGRVRFVGEAVAAVVADTLNQAKDAAEAIVVDYEDLGAVTTPQAALQANAPLLCDSIPDNIAAEMRHGSADKAAAGFAAAAHVVKLQIHNQRLNALPIEPRTVLANYAPDPAKPGDGLRLQVQLSNQMPTAIREGILQTMGKALGLTHQDVRVVLGDVGGGFGMKTGAYPEDIVTAYCAHRLRGPVKWVAERSEEFLATVAGRDVHVDAEMALGQDGRILALRLKSLANIGAYATGAGVAIQLMIGPWVQTSVYHVPVIDFHFKAVLTNTAPTGPYRGAGRPEAIYNMERLMDEAARQTGIDRVQLRRVNFVSPTQMPYKNAMGQVYDSGQFEHVMNQGLALADWNGFAAREAQSKARGKWRGLGLATFLEWTGGNALEETCFVTVKADGFIEVATAVNPMGQGIGTSLAQLVVDAFGVPIEKVRVLMGDTDRANGFGSAGSRSLFTGGSSIAEGSEKTIAKARELAAQEFEVAGEDLDYADATFSVKGTDLKVGLFELAAKQEGQQIHVQNTHAVAGPSWPNGCHVVEVEVDPATAQVAVVAYASVNDVGRVINPMIVRGQLDGGAVQGLGQALTEAVRYDPESGQLLTGSLMDYAAPKADIFGDSFSGFKTEMDPSTPCKNNRLGVKGVGELGTIGATPAAINAIADALARNGRGALAPRLQMPATSAAVWELLQVQ